MSPTEKQTIGLRTSTYQWCWEDKAQLGGDVVGLQREGHFGFRGTRSHDTFVADGVMTI